MSVKVTIRRKPVPAAFKEQHVLTTSAHIGGGGWGGWRRVYRTRGDCSCGARWPESKNTDNLNYADVLDAWKDHVAKAFHGDDYFTRTETHGA